MIELCFLWHMHQPLYIDPTSGSSILPWVRMHATRAYYDMIKVAMQYPGVHSTYNLVPVLIAQLKTLQADGDDRYRKVASRPADGLSEMEARFLLEFFFQVDWDTCLKPHAGYRRLLELRGFDRPEADAHRRFSVQDLRDLQVWFNLAWFGFSALKDFPELKSLIEKQSHFSEDDKVSIFRIQDTLLSRILGLYREARRTKVVELSTTPYYHPILPLLCDTNATRRALPHAPLPSPAFQYEADANAQVTRAVASHLATFGARPEGMWPAEGSVSPEIIPLMEEAGLKWFATSEGILHHSTLEAHAPAPLRDGQGRPSVFQPYLVGKMAAFFRHLELSDRIGFVYARMNGRDAAADFLGRVRQAVTESEARGQDAIVPIILDGENPWEHYYDGGESFLHSLYQQILEAPDLRGLTFSEALERHPPAARVKKLWSGSWIGSSYAIWAGHPEDVAGWERLSETRAFLEEAAPSAQPAALAAARECIYAAEGSDWFWWFGDEFSSQADAEFDRLFRAHLEGVYLALGQTPPRSLSVPIKGMQRLERLKRPRAVVRAQIDGRLTTYYEWVDAGEVRLVSGGGAMARGSQLLRKLAYGFDQDAVYLRVDFGREILELDQIGPELDVMVTSPRKVSVRLPLVLPDPTSIKVVLLRKSDADPDGLEFDGDDYPAHELIAHHDGRVTEGPALPAAVRAASADVLEVALPRALLGLETAASLEFSLMVLARGREVLRYPSRAMFQLEVPAPGDLETYWSN